MAIGRIIRNTNGFERVTLTEEEETEVLQKLREKNLELYKRCFEDAMQLVTKGPTLVGLREMIPVAEIAGALFRKQAIDARDALTWKLEEKVFYAKEYARTLEAMEV